MGKHCIKLHKTFGVPARHPDAPCGVFAGSTDVGTDRTRWRTAAGPPKLKLRPEDTLKAFHTVPFAHSASAPSLTGPIRMEQALKEHEISARQWRVRSGLVRGAAPALDVGG